MRIIMIDNYDSFTFNLAQLFYEFDAYVKVCRHDEISIRQIQDWEPDAICISPGPKTPAHSGVSKDVVKFFGPRIPVLGVCLGMQVINEVFRGITKKAPVCVHGKCSTISHKGQGIFKGIKPQFRAARYHSLCVSVNSPELMVTAISEDGVVMAVQHVTHPIFGVQFHPESFMTQYGLELVGNFLEIANPRVIVPPPGPDRFPYASGDVHACA